MASKTTEEINQSMTEKVSEPTSIPSPIETMKRLSLNAGTIYVQADSFVNNPNALLGVVFEVRRIGPECPSFENLSAGTLIFSQSVITGVKVKEGSNINKPIKRGSIVVDQKLAVGMSFLNYLSADFSQDTTFSLMVFDQMVGTAERGDGSWDDGLDKWKSRNAELMTNDDVCAIYAVIGYTQKYIIRRKFKKFQLGTKGGYMGLNVHGELYTSSEDSTLDILYGLEIVVIKHLPANRQPKVGIGFTAYDTEDPGAADINLVQGLALKPDFKFSL